jgi:hypothetical protein
MHMHATYCAALYVALMKKPGTEDILLTPRAEQASQDAPLQAARHLSELTMGAKINGSELSGVYVTHGYQHVEQQQARRQGNTHVLRCTRAHAHGESRF